MNQTAIENASRELARLYSTEAAAARFFEWAANRSTDPTETTIDQLEKNSDADRAWCITFAKRLSLLGLGEYVVGRKGGVTRIIWSASVRAIGNAAKPHGAVIDNRRSHETHAVNQRNPSDEVTAPLTILDAKRRLAHSLGVSVESIEIIIRG